MTNDDGRKPEGAPERSPKASAGAPSGVDGNGPKRFSVQRKMTIVATAGSGAQGSRGREGAAGRGCGCEGRRGTSVQKGFGRPEQSSSRSTRNLRPSVPGSSRATW